MASLQYFSGSTTRRHRTSLPTRGKLQMDKDRKSIYHLDADTLECPLCTEPLTSPVYQCENGHIACGPCCEKLTKGCPSCSQPTGRIRCLAVEKIIESLQVACKHAHHGCKEMLRYNKKDERDEHEQEECKYKPVPCYIPCCMHEGPKFTLPDHLAKDHKVGKMQLDPVTGSVNFIMSGSNYFMMVAFDDEDSIDGGLLLVHRESKSFLGDAFYCTTISGPSKVYNLRVKCRAGSSLYILETTAPDIAKNVPKFSVSKEYLLIPSSGDNANPREFDLQLSFPNSNLPSSTQKLIPPVV
ncbi:hypothetical protein KC19_8G108600 [Ceratodon purpureus]|uniref:RING-type E3 ubiquitin transferase n=1 Tax=Ceratodon purpureus TaxID=3225 RepID=A0A8T0H220_CERPU|nr:hypothetical protein KC19_8G108600 [Ceratodon purpureus]